MLKINFNSLSFKKKGFEDNEDILNEVTHLLGKPAIQYEEKHGAIISAADKSNMIFNVINNLRNSIEDDVFTVLEGNKPSVLKQLDIFNILGSGDAVNAAIANEYGISFLTVDNKLVNNLFNIQSQLTDIHNVYYTSPSYQS